MNPRMFMSSVLIRWVVCCVVGGWISAGFAIGSEADPPPKPSEPSRKTTAPPAKEASKHREKPRKPAELIPFYKELDPPDRILAQYCLDEISECATSGKWERIQPRIHQLLLARLIYGADKPAAWFSLTYFYLLSQYLPLAHFEGVEEAEIQRFQKWLVQNPEVAGPLVLAISPEDKSEMVLKKLYELYHHDPDSVRRLPELATAFAIVLDQQELDVQKMLEHFSWLAGDRPFAFPIGPIPHELACHLVYSDVSQYERQGVYDFYRSCTDMAQVYSDVVYDFDALREKQPPRLQGRDCTLENILIYGGVCVNQTYMAIQTGRAKGYPMSNLAFGGPGLIGHAWAAQFVGSAEGPQWHILGNCSNSFGWTFDPATNHRGSDQTLEFLGWYVRQPTDSRLISLGCVRLAERLAAEVKADTESVTDEAIETVLKLAATPNPPLPIHLAFFKKRKGCELNSDLVDEMYRLAYQQCPTQPELWQSVIRLAKARLIPDTKTMDWMNQLAKLTGTTYPDVLYYALLEVCPVLDEKGQELFLDAALGQITDDQLKRSPTLVAEIYLQAGDVFVRRGEKEKAIETYLKAIQLKPDFGPVAIPALTKLIPLLTESGRAQRLREEADRLLASSDDPVFQVGLLPALVKSGDKQAALERLIYIVEHGDVEKAGYFPAARQAIDILVEMGELEWALSASKNLYGVTQNLGDGRRVTMIMRKLGQTAAADEADKKLDVIEKQRLEQIEMEAQQRRDELRHRNP